MRALIYSMLEMIHFTKLDKSILDRHDLKASRLVASITFDSKAMIKMDTFH